MNTTATAPQNKTATKQFLKYEVDGIEHHIYQEQKQEFESQVKSLNKWFNFIGEEEVLESDHEKKCNDSRYRNKVFHSIGGLNVEAITAKKSSTAKSPVKSLKRKIPTTLKSTGSKKDWREQLQDLELYEDDKLNQIETKINELEAQVNQLFNEAQEIINFELIKDTSHNSKLGRDLSEEDINMILLTYDEEITSGIDLVDLPLATRRAKAVNLIQELPDTKEYDLAVEQRVATIKNKVIGAVKSGIKLKLEQAIEDNLEKSYEAVVAISDELAQMENYQEEAEKLKQAKLEKEIREIRKKRERKRIAVMSTITEVAIDAVVDDCVEQTRDNIIAQFNNTVDIAKITKKQLVEEENRNPDKDLDAYNELTEIVVTKLKDKKYQLSEIKVGSDLLKNSVGQSQLGELEKISAAEAVNSTNGKVPQTVDTDID